jgi:hypothetical protein
MSPLETPLMVIRTATRYGSTKYAAANVKKSSCSNAHENSHKKLFLRLCDAKGMGEGVRGGEP